MYAGRAAARPARDQLTIQHTFVHQRTRPTHTGDVKRHDTRHNTRRLRPPGTGGARRIEQTHPPAQLLALCAPAAGRRCHERAEHSSTARTHARAVQRASARHRATLPRPGAVVPSAGGTSRHRATRVHPWPHSAESSRPLGRTSVRPQCRPLGCATYQRAPPTDQRFLQLHPRCRRGDARARPLF